MSNIEEDNTYSTTFRMNEAAKILDVGIGRTTLFRTLRDMGILDKNNTPYQRYIDQGYFKLTVKARDYGYGYCDKVTLVTEKGLAFLVKKLASGSNPSLPFNTLFI